MPALPTASACGAIVFAALCSLTPARAASSNCDAMIPTAAEAAIARRAPRVDDLIGLRDIGEPDSSLYRLPSPLGLSPNGSQVAFVVKRADPDANRTCAVLITLNLSDGVPHMISPIDTALLMEPVDVRGQLTPLGIQAINAPIWSPDGRWIAYLRPSNTGAQVWIVSPDGIGLRQISNLASSVMSFRWSADSSALLVQTRGALPKEESRLANEGRTGFFYDSRFVPNMSNRPQISSSISTDSLSIDVATGRVRSLGQDTSGIPSADDSDRPPRAELIATSSTGWTAWTAPVADLFESPVGLHIRAPGKSVDLCRWATCNGNMVGVWWLHGGTDLYFLRPEGWARNAFAMYRWRPGSGPPVRTFLTKDILSACQASGSSLLCLRDASTSPRRLVRIDVESGSIRTVFDPNPVFSRLELGSSQRLYWRNADGVETFGDLVLPPHYRPGVRLPLVVVQYDSEGFLRGGTGDEIPIQAMATEGFAILNVEEPSPYAKRHAGMGWPSWADAERANIVDWRDRRSHFSSVVEGARLVVSMGIADPAHIGLTGMSDGASTARFAMINSRVFAAVSISTCCMEPTTSMIYGGEAWAEGLRKAGYQSWRPSEAFPSVWAPYSLTMNASKKLPPLLMQLSDDEYLLALQTFEALRDQSQPVEMYVFPDEHHSKWQPAHRLAIYRRNIDWFNFWLRGISDASPAKREQYARWSSMRSNSVTISGASGHLATPRHRPAP
ncbi:Atxe2 family lasso peptide isopeptidase [Sphingomonas sp. CGMCC 1.13654]|uniref:Atxe2 family lasso peptide isopeptidase n=1 Tax=Sphingomonas chungangi TaxID=2683589 RepID=A0A838L627_9SPHN|nr:Atxe2 family lasso peptide isopeptidase [Sphingomonas chungangi]MBA2934624.1 Atxe2 family lasso peptide isopeptidase [Sphingomonas chungangi]MVW57660.1 Atxe2 family lasso peptide isopeptidase [Sphingomonas chungangi]